MMTTRYELRTCTGRWMADFERREHADFWARMGLEIRPRVLDMLLPGIDCIKVVRVRSSRRTMATVRPDGAGGR